jgi:hypothetical protein
MLILLNLQVSRPESGNITDSYISQLMNLMYTQPNRLLVTANILRLHKHLVN